MWMSLGTVYNLQMRLDRIYQPNERRKESAREVCWSDSSILKRRHHFFFYRMSLKTRRISFLFGRPFAPRHDRIVGALQFPSPIIWTINIQTITRTYFIVSANLNRRHKRRFWMKVYVYSDVCMRAYVNFLSETDIWRALPNKYR